MSDTKAPGAPVREFNKVDRALELLVIDWLQWGEFPERLDKPSMPALALELIAKRKAANDALLAKLQATESERDELRQNENKLNAALSAKQDIINGLNEDLADLKKQLKSNTSI